ncbi:MAG: alanine racemase, partial [Rhodanobacter sp.]
VVQANWQVDAIEQFHPARPLTIWLKLDSGMHRLGLPISVYAASLQRLQAMTHVADVVTMTHFSRADELDSPRTTEQQSVFETTCDAGLPSSLSNSAALLGWPGVHGEWARPGLMLYGVNPFGIPHPLADQLQPVMTVTSKVISVRTIEVGEPVGYGARFVAQRVTRVGVVAMGYADGYPQFAPNGTAVTIDGEPGELIGRVSMDMLTVDLTDHPQAGLGSRVELWGGQISVDRLARHAGSSAYSLLCGLKRVPRSYLNG